MVIKETFNLGVKIEKVAFYHFELSIRALKHYKIKWHNSMEYYRGASNTVAFKIKCYLSWTPFSFLTVFSLFGLLMVGFVLVYRLLTVHMHCHVAVNLRFKLLTKVLSILHVKRQWKNQNDVGKL